MRPLFTELSAVNKIKLIVNGVLNQIFIIMLSIGCAFFV